MKTLNGNVNKKVLLGTAVCLCLGLPLVAQARSGDPQNNISRADRFSHGHWSDSRSTRDRYYDDYDSVYPDVYNNDYRYEQNDREYTDQYGDIDNTQNTNNYRDRNRYRSTSNRQDSHFRNDLRRGDTSLRASIIDELEGSPYVDSDRIDVRVRNGVAILTGTVEDRDALIAAEENAYEGGARKVVNNLRIARLDDRPWQDMSDSRLAEEVRDELDSDRIRVRVRDGIVTLDGTVEDRSEMSAAVENAYEAGARRVNNQLRTMN
jgi:osmotically-inducible protein OsmY